MENRIHKYKFGLEPQAKRYLVFSTANDLKIENSETFVPSIENSETFVPSIENSETFVPTTIPSHEFEMNPPSHLNLVDIKRILENNKQYLNDNTLFQSLVHNINNKLLITFGGEGCDALKSHKTVPDYSLMPPQRDGNGNSAAHNYGLNTTPLQSNLPLKRLSSTPKSKTLKNNNFGSKFLEEDLNSSLGLSEISIGAQENYYLENDEGVNASCSSPITGMVFSKNCDKTYKSNSKHVTFRPTPDLMPTSTAGSKTSECDEDSRTSANLSWTLTEESVPKLISEEELEEKSHDVPSQFEVPRKNSINPVNFDTDVRGCNLGRPEEVMVSPSSELLASLGKISQELEEEKENHKQTKDTLQILQSVWTEREKELMQERNDVAREEKELQQLSKKLCRALCSLESHSKDHEGGNNETMMNMLDLESLVSFVIPVAERMQCQNKELGQQMKNAQREISELKEDLTSTRLEKEKLLTQISCQSSLLERERARSELMVQRILDLEDALLAAQQSQSDDSPREIPSVPLTITFHHSSSSSSDSDDNFLTNDGNQTVRRY